MKRTLEQNKQMHALFHKLGITEMKSSLALEYSDGRTESTSDLTYDEADMLIKNLEVASRTGKTVNDKDGISFRPGNKMRRKIFFYFRKSGYLTKSGNVDVRAVENWVLHYGYLKKDLMQYTPQELPKLVSQAEAVYESFKQSINA